MKRSNKKGFTLVELLVVIAIIAILAAVAVPTALGIVKKGHKSNFESIRDGLANNIKIAAQAAAGETLSEADIVDSLKLDKPNEYITKIRVLAVYSATNAPATTGQTNDTIYIFFESNDKKYEASSAEKFVEFKNITADFQGDGATDPVDGLVFECANKGTEFTAVADHAAQVLDGTGANRILKDEQAAE